MRWRTAWSARKIRTRTGKSEDRQRSRFAPIIAAIISISRWKTTAAASTMKKFARPPWTHGLISRRAPRAQRTRLARPSFSAGILDCAAQDRVGGPRRWPGRGERQSCALNGDIEIDTEKALGTRFTLKVPLTLIISQALFVRCGTSMFAFPLAFVEEIRRLPTTTLKKSAENC